MTFFEHGLPDTFPYGFDSAQPPVGGQNRVGTLQVSLGDNFSCMV